MSEQIETLAKRKQSKRYQKPLNETNKKRAKMVADQNCLIEDEAKFQVGQEVSDAELVSLLDSELIADVEPELSDMSSNAARNAKTQE